MNEVRATLAMRMRYTLTAHGAGIIECDKATARLSRVSRALIIASSTSRSADTTKSTIYYEFPMPPPLLIIRAESGPDGLFFPGKGNGIGRQVDFGMTSSFTGEDERFAYKRARSRLREMCGGRWHARSEPGWWRPLPIEVRGWERSSASSPMASQTSSTVKGDVKLGESHELDKPAGLQGKELEEREKMTVSPFREKRDPPPKIGWTHAWGMMKWEKKAGAWGQGPDGLGETKDRSR